MPWIEQFSYMLWPFDVFSCYLVCFLAVWYNLLSFVTFFMFWYNVPGKIWQPCGSLVVHRLWIDTNDKGTELQENTLHLRESTFSIDWTWKVFSVTYAASGSGASRQGDQIGRIFAHCVIVYSVVLLWKLHKYIQFWTTFYHVKSYVLTLTKMGLATFGSIFSQTHLVTLLPAHLLSKQHHMFRKPLFCDVFFTLLSPLKIIFKCEWSQGPFQTCELAP
jgi:hypothetical protein